MALSYTKIKSNWFEILIGLILGFFIIFGLYQNITGKKGSWSKYYYNPFGKQTKRPQYNRPTKRGPPKQSKGEVECRRVLEKIFNKPFPNVRPDFLRNDVTSDGGEDINLEIDCYNEELGLGIEYSGAMHYKYIPFFHKTKDAFYNQRYRDELKRRMCKDAGITLIEVPYTVKNEDIENFLKKELRRVRYI